MNAQGLNAAPKESIPALLWRLWRDPAAWATTVDVFAILLALSLPWSTLLVSLFASILVIVKIPFLSLQAFIKSLFRPICVLPIALFALAVVGTLWSDAPWATRLHAISPPAKLLVLPVLFYHFERSARGAQVLTAFLVSCALLLVMSWIVVLDPSLSLQHKPDSIAPGIFVKNYIDQSQEFALCAVALAYPVVILLREKKFLPAMLLMALSLSFVVNMLFVVVSRTTLVTMPVLLAIFAALYLSRRSAAIILFTTIGLAALAWTISPQLRSTTESFATQYREYKEGSPSSVGLRLEFWQKSLRFFAEAPVFGHGTGSTRGLFEQAAIGQAGAAAEIIGNPHNQTLNVAVQWGVVGVVVLYAVWLRHLLLFRGAGLVGWIGLLVVLQNIFTSLFNSHLFDFHEGWMYVLGVGVAGGMVLKAHSQEMTPGP